MAETTLFELVSPEKLLISQDAEMVVVPGSEGDFGAMPRHSPMITSVRPGLLDVYQGGKIEQRLFIAGGFAEVTESRVTVLADEAFPLADLTMELVQSRLTEADLALATAASEPERRDAARQVAVAQAMRAALA